MEYHVQFGTLRSKVPSNREVKKFRLAILGDFSGRGGSSVEVGSELASRKPLRVNHENLDDLLARLDVKLNLPAGASGAMIKVPIGSMEDFHPDQLYGNVPLFEKLVSLRQKLLDPSSFEKAAAAVRSLAGDPEIGLRSPSRNSVSTAIPRQRIDSFADLIHRETPASSEPELKTLLRDVVGAHVVPEMKGQSELLAAVDASLTDLMRKLLHHPDFQSMESLWRSVDFLIHRLELDGELEVVLYDVSAAEFAADLAHTEALEETGLYRWLVENPAHDASQGPLSLIVCNYVFEQIPPHAELLARAAKIAAAAGAPMIASIDREWIKKQEPEDVPLITKQAWEALRGLPESAYIALTTPRFMLRWPFGKKTEPIESFAFEEFTPQSGLSGMLWGNSSILAGLLIAQTFLNDGLKGMKLGSVLTIDDLPFYFYNDRDGDQVALPCTERLVNVRSSQYVVSQGFIPVLSMQGRSDVRLGGLHAVGGQQLAGPWGQVEIKSSMEGGGVSTLEEVPAPTPAEPQAQEPAQDSGASDADAELDQLLASLDESTAPPPAAGENDVDAELAALLADL